MNIHEAANPTSERILPNLESKQKDTGLAALVQRGQGHTRPRAKRPVS
jgi:hypothetical protein